MKTESHSTDAYAVSEITFGTTTAKSTIKLKSKQTQQKGYECVSELRRENRENIE